jgi:ATP-binding cassette subfamily B protein
MSVASISAMPQLKIAMKNIIPYFLKEVWRHKKLVIPILFLAPSTIILERYIAPLFIAYILGHIQTGDISLQNSVWILVGFILIELYSQVFAYRLILWMMWTVQIRGQVNLYNESYEKLSRHSLAFYANTFTGSLVSKVNRFTSSYVEFVNSMTYNVLFVATTIVATIVGLSIFFWQYALVVLGLTIIFIVCVFFGTRILRKRFLERSESYTAISGKLSDSISNMLTVKTDAREKDEQNVLGGAVDNMFAKEMATRNSMIKITSVYSFIITLMRVGALVASILTIQYGFGNAAVVYICLTYTFNLIDEIWNVSNILRSYYQITGDAAETLEIIEQPAGIVDKSNKKLSVKNPSVVFDAISFTHDEGEDDASQSMLFDQFSLSIKSRQKIGLVGVSGSGKSSLLKLLMRFYDVADGKVLIDGQDVSMVTQESLHQNIAYVPQEPLLFHRTILENISYSRPKATEKEIREAAEQANALEFIEKLPKGFETMVGERGVKLSGGQRQRIAIARAILKDAPILILDEATSALDSESEKLIQDALEKLMKNRTSIVIAHRLSTIANLDRIVLLYDGRIQEDGSHDELLSKKGAYAKLWAHQSGGFIEE